MLIYQYSNINYITLCLPIKEVVHYMVRGILTKSTNNYMTFGLCITFFFKLHISCFYPLVFLKHLKTLRHIKKCGNNRKGQRHIRPSFISQFLVINSNCLYHSYSFFYF